MTEEKTLPQDESAKGQDIFNGGPVPATRDGRIKLATEKGGLKSCPASFTDEYLDWEIIKSDNPFEILYLDYRVYDRVTRAMIDGNFAVIKKFWTDTAAKAMSSPPVVKKYGGIDSIRRYPQILQKAYADLTADANAPKQWFEQIIQNKQEFLNPDINDLLRQGEYTPDIGRDIKSRGKGIGLTEEEASKAVIDVLKYSEFEPEEQSVDPLSVRWYSQAKKKTREEEKHKAFRNELDSAIEGVLADGEYEPKELISVKEKGKKLNYSEEETLKYFEQQLIAQGFSSDPDANIKESYALEKKLSVSWRTNEKHFEVSKQRYISFLEGKLHSGIYEPENYISIAESATGNLKRDSIKLNEILIAYLKDKGFNPVKAFRPKGELTVAWRTSWATNPLTPPLPPPTDNAVKTPLRKSSGRPKIIIAIIVILAALYQLNKWNMHSTSNPAPKQQLSAPNQAPQNHGASLGNDVTSQKKSPQSEDATENNKDLPKLDKVYDDLNQYVESVTSTSLTRDNNYNIDYRPDNLMDNIETTTWATDLRKDLNPSIVFKFKQPVRITGITSLPGYKKFFIVDRYLQNHKPKRVLLTYDNVNVSDTITFTLANSHDALLWQTFPIQKPIITRSVTLKILDTYPGIRQGKNPPAHDVCISEFHFLGHPADR